MTNKCAWESNGNHNYHNCPLIFKVLLDFDRLETIHLHYHEDFTYIWQPCYPEYPILFANYVLQSLFTNVSQKSAETINTF